MNTTIKSILLPALGLMLVTSLNAQKIAANDKTENKGMIRIKIKQNKDGAVTQIDTVISANDTATMKKLGIELPHLPRIPKAPRDINDKECKRIVINKQMDGKDSMRSQQEIEKEIELMEKEFMLEKRCEMAEGKNAKHIVIIEEENKNGKTEKVMKKIVMREVLVNDVSEEEKKNLREGIKGENTLTVQHLNFYPNPNNGKFNLSFNLKEKGTTTISIFNSEGKKVYRESLPEFSGDYSNTIDLSGSPNGIYFLNVEQGKKNLVKKIVIQ